MLDSKDDAGFNDDSLNGADNFFDLLFFLKLSMVLKGSGEKVPRIG